MSLSISSFKKKKSSLIIFLITLILLMVPFEYNARTRKWSGGFNQQIDPQHVNNMNDLTVAYDLLIVGSSRAKESIRPSAFSSFFNTEAKVYNHGCHSCVSPLVIKNMLALNPPEIKLPKNLIVTVEPLHFTQYGYPNSKKDSDPTSTQHSLLWTLAEKTNTINDNILKKINDKTSSIVYGIIKTSDPTNRSFLHMWGFGIFEGLRKSITNNFNLISFLNEFTLYTFAKGSRWHSVVVNLENGYEGHILKFIDSNATRHMSFENQIQIYEKNVLPTYDKQYIEPFKNNLKKLIDSGVNVILVRLPIYIDLYNLEEKMTPQFNLEMIKLAKMLSIQYIDNNQTYPEISHDPMCFIDASHMNHEMTDKYSQQLFKSIQPFLVR